MESWLRRRKIFSDPVVMADAYGRTIISITVKTKDRWTNHNRAMYFAAAIAARAKVRMEQLGEPIYLPLPPHSNRGQGRRGPTGIKRPCKIQPCEKHAHTLGMCQPHYQKLRYWGDPLGGPWLKEQDNGTGADIGAPVEPVRSGSGPDPDNG